jgi:hypothetical protein
VSKCKGGMCKYVNRAFGSKSACKLPHQLPPIIQKKLNLNVIFGKYVALLYCKERVCMLACCDV